MKKALVITYYWAPAGGPGVQRWLKFVKYLRDFGIEPIIYTPLNPTYPMVDTHTKDKNMGTLLLSLSFLQRKNKKNKRRHYPFQKTLLDGQMSALGTRKPLYS